MKKIIFLIGSVFLYLIMMGSSYGRMAVIGHHLKYDPNLLVNGGRPITVKLWYNEDWAGIYEKWSAAYHRIHPNVTFEYYKMGWGIYENKLAIALRAGNGPDIFHMHSAWTDLIIDQLEPLPESLFPLEQLRADFRQVDSHIINGKLYCIDVGFVTSAIFYNRKMWAAAGLRERDFPKTWDALRQIAQKLTRRDAAGRIIVNGFDFNNNGGWLLLALNYQKGVYNFKKDGRTCQLSQENSLANARMLQDIIRVDKVLNPQGAPDNEAFGNGRSALIYGWGWVGNYLESNFPEVKWGCFKLPTFDGAEPPAYDRNNGECSLCVNKNAQPAAKKAALDFAKYFLANDEAMLQVCLTACIAPSKYALDQRRELFANPVINVEMAVINHTIWPGLFSSCFDQNISGIINDELFLRGAPAEQVLKKIDAEVTAADLEVKFATVERKYKYAGLFKE